LSLVWFVCSQDHKHSHSYLLCLFHAISIVARPLYRRKIETALG